MTKAELESKRLAELHALAAERGVPRYRMLPRAQLIEALVAGEPEAARGAPGGPSPARAEERAPRRRRGADEGGGRERAVRAEEPPARPPRRRRRRFGRRRHKEVSLPDLLLPPTHGRQALAFAESREGCTALLREIAAELSAASKGPDPIALLIDPSPDELAEWKRGAPQAEIVSAGQPRHADDALAQALGRARGGEDVVLLVDSLTRLAEAYGDADVAREFLDSGREVGSGGGSLTVVAALERSA